MTGEFDALARAATQSYAGRAVRFGADRLAAAWASSLAVTTSRRLGERASALPPADRVRFGAIIVGTALIAYGAMLSVIPPYVATGIPRAWFFVVGLLAFAAAGASARVAEAWPRSGVARLARWLTH
jgi:hypothetical protein